MSNNNRHTNHTGMSLPGTLTLIFIVLKLVGVVKWSWLVVFSPTIIALVLILIAVAIYELL